MKGEDDKTIAELEKEAIKQFNEDYKKTLDRETKMIQHQLWRGSKLPPFNIEHMHFERERLHKPMTDEDRFLRKQWLDDQKLAPNEPRFIPELYPKNIFRRTFAKPWDAIFNGLTPILGKERAIVGRFFVPKFFMAIGSVYAAYYYIKYNKSTWMDKHGWNVYGSKDAVYDLDYKAPEKPLDDFFDRGFKARTVLRD